jgi:hypothetical protein
VDIITQKIKLHKLYSIPNIIYWMIKAPSITPEGHKKGKENFGQHTARRESAWEILSIRNNEKKCISGHSLHIVQNRAKQRNFVEIK